MAERSRKMGAIGAPTQLGSKISEVSAEVEQLHRETEFCQKATTELEGRIGPVLKTPPPSNEAESEKDISLTPLASELRNINRQLKALGNFITSIRERVEL